MYAARRSYYTRRAVNNLFVHTYVWIDKNASPVLDIDGAPTYDKWGNQIFEDAYIVPGRKGLYTIESVSTTTASGTVSTDNPILYIPYDDEINIDDEVQTIRTLSGILVLNGAKVLAVDPLVDLGESVAKRLTLVGARTA